MNQGIKQKKRKPERQKKKSGLYGIWTGSNPVQAWIFFPALFSQLQKLRL